jgi:trypsin-like peptidase/NACHT domain-containing protein
MHIEPRPVGLENLVRSCTVQITGANEKLAGSGFFVAPNTVVTAAHVLADVRSEVFVVLADGRRVGPAVISKMEPYWPAADGVFGLPDLALLSLSETDAPGHPCVLLGELPEGPNMRAEGYSVGATVDVAPDSSLLVFETLRPEAGCVLISCSGGLLSAGQSGGPLLDYTTGRVVGVVKARRGNVGPMGGVAVAAREIQAQWPEVWQANEEFHRVDRRWQFARDGGGDADSVEATIEVLRAIIAHSQVRTTLLPALVEPSRIHQPPWVYPLANSDTDVDADLTEVSAARASNRPKPRAAFKWNPLRCPWPTIVVHGLPGYGKSWLLRTHVASVARNSLARLQAEDGMFAAVQVPLLISCAAFGHALKKNPGSPVEAVIEAFASEFDQASYPTIAPAVIRSAHTGGLLTVCLDGFDELPSTSKEPVKLALAALAERRNQVILSSRPDTGLTTDLRVVLKEPFHVQVTGFAQSQLTSFIEEWFHRDPQKAAALKGKLADSPELRALARVPLLSSFLCLLTHETGSAEELPTSQNALYQAVLLGMLSGRWRDNAAQQAYDSENPPDAALRLSSLASAIGAITDTWRARTERFIRADLEEVLRSTPRYSQLKANAEARWVAHQEQRRTEATRYPVNMATWEYLFDGLLIADTQRSDRPGVRFAHPMLGEYCAAMYLADLPTEEMLATLEKHRWFDPAWREVFPTVAERTGDIDVLVSWLLVDEDPWHEQTMIAARCAAAAYRGGNGPSTASREALLDRIGLMFKSPRIFDQSRGLEALAGLVRGRMPEAVARARVTALDQSMPVGVRLGLTAALGERGDDVGRGLAKSNIHNPKITDAWRVALARAILLSGADGATDEVMRFLHAASTDAQADIVAGIPVEAPAGLDFVVDIMQNQELPAATRIRAGRALVNLGGAEVVTVRMIVRDRFAHLDVRGGLAAELITSGEDDLVPLGRELVEDVNLTYLGLVPLVQALLRRGDLTVIDRARDMLTNQRINWTERATAARLLVELGEIGVRVLRDQLSVRSISIGYKVRNFIELIRAHEAQEIEEATRIVLETSYPTWVRCRLATALIQNDVPLEPDILDAALALTAISEDRTTEFQIEVLVALTAKHVPGAIAAIRAFLARAGRTPETWMTLCRGVSASGGTGHDALAEVVRDTGLPAEGRMIAVIAVAAVSSASAARLAAPILEEALPGYLRTAFIIHLAHRGAIEMTGELLGILGSTQTGYAALYDVLSSPRADSALVESCIAAVAGLSSELIARERAETGVPRLTEDWLAAVGITWSSDAEKGRKLQQVNTQLEKRIWARLQWILLPVRERQNQEGTEDEVHLLARDLMHEVAVLETELLKNELLSGRFQLDGRFDNLTALEHLGVLADVLNQWVSKTVSRNIGDSARFLKENDDVILRTESMTLLQVAASLVGTWPPYEAHRYLVFFGIEHGVDAALNLLLDSSEVLNLLRAHLAARSAGELLDAAGVGVLIDPGDASSWFYAGLGAAMQKNLTFATKLMVASRERASLRQRIQGLRTIRMTGERNDWPEELVELLQKALAGGDEDGEKMRRDGADGTDEEGDDGDGLA